MTRPRLAIAAGLLWRTVALALILIGLWTALASVGDWIAEAYPNPEPLPCVADDSCGDEYE